MSRCLVLRFVVDDDGIADGELYDLAERLVEGIDTPIEDTLIDIEWDAMVEQGHRRDMR